VKKLLSFALLCLLATSCGRSPNADSPLPPAQILLVPNYEGNSVTVRAVEPSDGSTREISGSPFPLPGHPKMVAVSNDNRFAYVTTQDEGIAGYAVNPATGAISQVPGSPFKQVAQTFSAAVHPNGRWLVAVGGKRVTVFNIQMDGSLTPVPGGSATIVSSKEFDFNPPALARNGQFLYVPGGDNGVYGFSIDSASGAVSEVPQGSYGTVKALCVHPSGDVLCVPVLNSSTLRSFRIAADGQLSDLSNAPLSYTPIGVVFSKAGKLYVGSSGASGLFGYSVSPMDGTFSALNGGVGFPGGASETNFPAVDPQDRLLYVSARGNDQVFGFLMDAVGNLTPTAGSPIGGFNKPDVPALIKF